ncbi:DUF397 domain-containing protein [Actinacidiphila oryziradicis]|jgi:hypothetical protein|uniref:DUF397 domain-containing protein n=1 Tax=Actinacidiphila oryziradicis TaxID=2571141 RepID=A0A4U0SUP5_9ACTN|nr:DUF397 domain-containing protein [Actinacidiphila oryziradicis]TKA13288.1 DUF397 domain-containing protein [Actinacidiphila oryziradicis]
MPAPIHWQNSSFSGGTDDGSNCVELAAVGGTIRLRESDAPDSVVTASQQQLAAFIRALKAGEFEPGIAHDV